jgi:hypothetical protein
MAKPSQLGDLHMNDSSHRRVRLARRLSWLVVGALTVAALVPGTVSATHDPTIAPNANSHQFVDGNPTCGPNQFFEFKVDPPVSGPVGPNGEIIISNLTAFSFDWALSADARHLYEMAAVIVKASNGAEVYFYTDTGDDSDTNLQSPANGGDQQAEISHIEFCFNQKGAPTPTPTPTPEPTPTPTPEPTPTPTPNPTPTPTPNPTPTPTPPPNPTPTPTPVPTPTPTPVPTPTPTPVPTPTPTPSPTGEVAGETGAPAVTLPPTDSLSSGNQGPAGDSWRLIVLALAGILAATLLLTPTETSRKRR